ncbi:hypothetical protein ACHAXR_009636 [Thalassiosira sp. AJA248-18]
MPPRPAATTGMDGSNKKPSKTMMGQEDEPVFDITQNMFPESRGRTFRSLSTPDLSARRPPPSARAPQSAFKDEEKSEMNGRRPPNSSAKTTAAAREESAFDIAQSSVPNKRARSLSTPSTFRETERSEMNDRRPLPKVKAKMVATKSSATSSEFKEKDKSETKSRASAMYQRWKSSFNEGERSEMNDRQPLMSSEKNAPRWTRKPDPTKPVPTEPADDTAYLDISTNFPKDRPSSLVNTGTKKRGTITTGSYEESKKTSKQAVRNGDDSYVDIMNFPEARPSLSVNTGTKKRGTTSGTYEESHRNIAHNFSPDRASLLGHSTRKVNKSSSQNDNYLDKQRFSSDLAPPSPVTAAATSAVWRDTSTVKEDEKYLDTPRAFAKNLDMMPSTRAKVVTKRTADSGNRKSVEYLNKNPFSSNLRSSTGNDSRQRATGQEFLDKPRPFQSNVDMVSSNTSGARFKRSSDIPPEEKNIKDYYDITTAPMPNIDEMAKTKMSRVKPSKGDDYVDITRIPMSTLERTFSVTRDANKASSVRSKGKSPMGSDSDQSVIANPVESGGDDAEESSYEEVMYWILTHLPQLQEEDAISYFNSLLEDGFDSIEMCSEVLEEDLYFMKKGHARSLLRSIQTAVEDDENEASTDPLVNPTDEDDQVISSEELDEMIDGAKAELEKTEAWIAEQNRLVEKRLAEETAAKEAAASDAKSENDEPFADITRSSFVDRPSLSQAAPGSPITRDLFPGRPNDLRERSKATSRLSTGSKKNDGDQEQFFDITRDAFQDRPSSDAAKATNDTPPPPPQNMTEYAPRAELYQSYIKKGFRPEQAQRLKEYFTTWDSNDAKSHELKFTSVFTCPITGEHFMCGSWRSGGEIETKDQTFWYKNKKQAMNAAAAKALDCFSLRECHGTGAKPIQQCEDAPYLSKDDAPALPALPKGISLPSKLVHPDD